MRSPPTVVSGLFAGRYVIERQIGQGATAIVHLARDTQAGRAVALKILRMELAESSATNRFLKEIRRTQALRHPHILPVLDSGEHDGQLYFALPYMEGGTLRLLLKREKNLELTRVVEISRTIAGALDYAHAKGMIHRDVKPENILFTSGEACLGDFGIARAIDLSGSADTTTSSHMVRGTAAYMSPEQAAGSPDLDGRSDVFSLACVIYEMITGMAAFIGPTPESVISQRFAHPPRDIRVYRPTAPPAVDAALSKAFAPTPSDRYRTAGELVDALEASLAASGSSAPNMPAAARTPMSGWKRLLLIAGATVVAVAPPQLPRPANHRRIDSGVLPDTTLIVVMPLSGTTESSAPWRHDDLLQQSLTRWRDIRVVDQFQIADAMKRSGSIASNADVATLARSLGAGRYVRGSLSPLGTEWRVSASLYDVSRDQPLYASVGTIPIDLSGAAAAYAALADALLLRGRAADSAPVSAVGSRSLPAVQAFSRGQSALGNWDLAVADSGFMAAMNFDNEYARASFWLAQVRAWQGLPPNTWGTLAERSAASLGQLNDRERRLALALQELGRGSYDSACSMYRTLRVRNDHDFAAWYGSGQCVDMDHAVLRDSVSRSGWRFRSSYYRAIQAYTKAFTLLPTAHRGLQRLSYARLRDMLFTSHARLRQGQGLDADTMRFIARPEWRGDTIAFIPYPAGQMPASTPESFGPIAKAVSYNRDLFHGIAASWAASLPGVAGAKEALAVSLEIRGDPASIDSLRAARRVSTTAEDSVRLTAREALLDFKFGFPEDPAALRRARTLADSLLRNTKASSPEVGRLLAALAALTGQCNHAAELRSSVATQRLEVIVVPRYMVADWDAAETKAAMGCPLSGRLTFAQLAQQISSAGIKGSQPMKRRAEATALGRAAILSDPPDSVWITRLSAAASSPLLRASHAVLVRDTLAARRDLLFDFDRLLPGDVTPDAMYVNAALCLRLGDTTAAIQRLDRILRDVRFFPPGLLESPVQIGALIRSTMLRADLAAKRKDTALARQLSSSVLELWSSPDPELAPSIRAVRRLAVPDRSRN